MQLALGCQCSANTLKPKPTDNAERTGFEVQGREAGGNKPERTLLRLIETLFGSGLEVRPGPVLQTPGMVRMPVCVCVCSFACLPCFACFFLLVCVCVSLFVSSLVC